MAIINDASAERFAMLRIMGLVLIFLLGDALSGTARAEVTVTPAAKGYDIEVSDQATSSELLDAITNATGVTIKGLPDETTLAANHLRSTTLERAIRMLMPAANFVVRFRPDNTPAQIIFLSASPDDNTAGSSESETDDPTAPDLQDPATDGGDMQGTGSDDDQSSQ
ncbi:hypothetical protein [Aestuariivirga sp.]|uniref:hypothetical protein n=1 Tax=Aestuariivirga sp. TaxID=2650926 RepID=UPI0035B3F680